MKQKWLQRLLPAAVLAFLALGMALALLCPRSMNLYENRYANQLPAPSGSAFLAGSFQDELETGLADQLPAASYLKKASHLVTRGFTYALASPLSRAHPDRYLSFYGCYLMGGNRLLYAPVRLSDRQAALDERIARIEAIHDSHPALPLSVFYIEKDTDMNFETGRRLEAGAWLQTHLTVPTDVYRVEDFQTFCRDFYVTDHHWNAAGADRAYRQLLPLLEVSDAPLEPQQEVVLSGSMTGSKAASCGAQQLSEPVCVYTYDFPPMTVTLDGQPAPDYGQLQSCLAGTDSALSYSRVYGGDNGEVILDTGRDLPSLLVLGESYDNALLKLLASHFGRLYAVDLRYYESAMGQPFRLDAYLQEHPVDRLLLVGNLDYFTQNEFALER